MTILPIFLSVSGERTQQGLRGKHVGIGLALVKSYAECLRLNVTADLDW